MVTPSLPYRRRGTAPSGRSPPFLDERWREAKRLHALGGLHDSELAAIYLRHFVAAKAGTRALQGEWERPLLDGVTSPHVAWFAEKRVWRVEKFPAQAVVMWWAGRRDVELLFHVPSALDVLELQSRGRRCVSLLDENVATDPHEDGLAFALHDLCHLEKFVADEHHREQLGFFRCMQRAVTKPEWSRFDARFDPEWIIDRDAIISDMNGSVVFLFAAVKMRLKMAVRRRIARIRGVPAPTLGKLSPDEEIAFHDELERVLDLMEVPTSLRWACEGVTKRRDCPDAALALRDHFSAL